MLNFKLYHVKDSYAAGYDDDRDRERDRDRGRMRLTGGGGGGGLTQINGTRYGGGNLRSTYDGGGGGVPGPASDAYHLQHNANKQRESRERFQHLAASALEDEKRITYDYRYGAPHSDKATIKTSQLTATIPAVTPLPSNPPVPPPPVIQLPDQQVNIKI